MIAPVHEVLQLPGNSIEKDPEAVLMEVAAGGSHRHHHDPGRFQLCRLVIVDDVLFVGWDAFGEYLEECVRLQLAAADASDPDLRYLQDLTTSDHRCGRAKPLEDFLARRLRP